MSILYSLPHHCNNQLSFKLFNGKLHSIGMFIPCKTVFIFLLYFSLLCRCFERDYQGVMIVNDSVIDASFNELSN